jgi:hypothetical protein
VDDKISIIAVDEISQKNIICLQTKKNKETKCCQNSNIHVQWLSEELSQLPTKALYLSIFIFMKAQKPIHSMCTKLKRVHEFVIKHACRFTVQNYIIL